MREFTYQSILVKKFQEKAAKNSAYKMSAFARDIGLTHGRLSEILQGKQGLSKTVAQQICRRLNFSEEEASYFLLLVTATHARSSKERHFAQVKLTKMNQNDKINFIETTAIKALQWHDLAILALFEIKNFTPTLENIRQKLNIQKTEAQKALENLEKQGFLKMVDSQYILNTQRIEGLVFSGATPEAIREINWQMMEKAKFAMEQKPVEERQIGSSIFALNKKEILEFKGLIRDFRRKIEDRAQELGNPDSVYCLGVQFFQLSNDD